MTNKCLVSTPIPTPSQSYTVPQDGSCAEQEAVRSAKERQLPVLLSSYPAPCYCSLSCQPLLTAPQITFRTTSDVSHGDRLPPRVSFLCHYATPLLTLQFMNKTEKTPYGMRGDSYQQASGSTTVFFCRLLFLQHPSQDDNVHKVPLLSKSFFRCTTSHTTTSSSSLEHITAPKFSSPSRSAPKQRECSQ